MSIKNVMKSFVMILVLLNASTALAAVAVSKDTSQRRPGVTSQNQMRRLTGFMKKMENNVLYLEDNSRYNLAGSWSLPVREIRMSKPPRERKQWSK